MCLFITHDLRYHNNNKNAENIWSEAALSLHDF